MAASTAHTSRPRTRRSPEERREQIVTAAVTLFARQGFARTTTREIAAEAGISEGTIYKYFASKQDLLFAFIAAYAVEPLQALLTASEGGGDEAVVRGFFLDRLTLAARNRPLIKVVMGEALFDAEFAREVSRKVTGPITARLEAFLSDRVRHGQFRGVNPRVAAGAMAGLFLTFAVLWPSLMPEEKHLPSIPALADELAALFLHGVAHPPGRQAPAAPSRSRPRRR